VNRQKMNVTFESKSTAWNVIWVNKSISITIIELVASNERMKCSKQFVRKIWKYHFEKSGVTATVILNTSSKQQGGKVWAGLNRLRRGRRGSAVSISNGPRPAQPRKRVSV
jgi:hypothetical protein